MPLSERKLPPLKDAGETLAFFQKHLYGVSPEPPASVRAERMEGPTRIFAGQVVREELRIGFDTPKGEFAFPLTLLKPTGDQRHPLFLYISFFPVNSDFKTPFEEIVDAGYMLAVLNYNAISKDERGAYGGLMELYPDASWGKIAAWTYAASRAMDALLARDDVDADRICVIGHSRLGKTALWCGANDSRFSLTAIVQSGCGGAAINRGKIGETLAGMTTTFPDWFSESFLTYAHHIEDHPYDQHGLLAAIAPRRAYISSAIEDEWADPASEYLSCAAAIRAYGEKLPDKLPAEGDTFHDTKIGYHLRKGLHALAREDWQKIIAYRALHGV